MTTAKSAAPAVEYVHNASRGEHQIGVRRDGIFVPFASLSDARYAQLEENAKAFSDEDSADDEDGN